MGVRQCAPVHPNPDDDPWPQFSFRPPLTMMKRLAGNATRFKLKTDFCCHNDTLKCHWAKSMAHCPKHMSAKVKQTTAVNNHEL